VILSRGPNRYNVAEDILVSKSLLNRRRIIDLDITQEEAARLLGISKNTWIRWEKREKVDNDMFAMLGMLSMKQRPGACSEMRFPTKWDWNIFDEHVRTCKECQLVVKYLAAVLKSTSPRNSAAPKSSKK